ncbi:hypothetical protein ACLOJK_036855 [Asimina triloba]
MTERSPFDVDNYRFGQIEAAVSDLDCDVMCLGLDCNVVCLPATKIWGLCWRALWMTQLVVETLLIGFICKPNERRDFLSAAGSNGPPVCRALRPCFAGIQAMSRFIILSCCSVIAC